MLMLRPQSDLIDQAETPLPDENFSLFPAPTPDGELLMKTIWAMRNLKLPNRQHSGWKRGKTSGHGWVKTLLP